MSNGSPNGDGTYTAMTPQGTEPAEEPEDREIDIPEDIYGAAMFSIIFDFYDIYSPHDNADELNTKMNIMRVVFINIVLLTNYLLQAGMLFWIYGFVVLPSVHTVEAIYQKYHADIFDEDGKYQKDAWASWDEGNKEELCGIAFASFWFMFAVLCLWCYTMLVEVRKTERLMKDIKAVEDCTKLEEMIQKEPDGPPKIVKLTKCIDWAIFLIIIVPKWIISLGLLFLGCVWLIATDSFSDLILNAVALEFVVNIDNLLFEAIMPVTVVEKVTEIKFLIKKSPESAKQRDDKVIGGYWRSIYYFFGTMVFVYLLMTYGQNIPIAGVLPHYAHDAECPTYQERISKRVCNGGGECFPFGGN